MIRLNSEHLDALGDHVAAIADKGPADQSLHTTISSSHDLYRRCSDSQRRLLNQAIFRKLYIADGRITDHDLTAGLHLGPQQSDATRQMPHLSRTP